MRRSIAFSGVLSIASCSSIFGFLALLVITGNTWGAGAARTQMDVAYAQVKGESAYVDIYLPAEAAQRSVPLAIRFSASRGNFTQIPQQLVARGYAVALVGYVPGMDSENEPKVGTDLLTCNAAIAFLRSHAAAYGIDPRRVAVFGSENGATLAALVALRNAAESKYGQSAAGDTRVSCVAMLKGVPDLTTAELQGDESVNELTGPAFVFLRRNPKEGPEQALAASPMSYVDENSPALLMVTGELDHRRPMYQKWSASVSIAGATSALFVKPKAWLDLDDAATGRALADFFDQHVGEAPRVANSPAAERVNRLLSCNLFAAAQRLADAELSASAAAEVRLRINKEQVQQNLVAFQDAIVDHDGERAQSTLWAIRSGPNPPAMSGLQSQFDELQRRFDHRLYLALQFASVNTFAGASDWAGADHAVNQITGGLLSGGLITASAEESAGPEMLLAARYSAARAKAISGAMPAGTRPFVWASGYGSDLYGYWMDVRIGGANQRFRYVPAGVFSMGAAANDPFRLPDEPVMSRVRMDRGFWIAESLTTQDTYQSVMGRSANHSFFRGAKFPVDTVSFADACNFARAIGIGARLPSEAEFEYACRGPDGNPTPTGRLNDSAWFWNTEQDQGRDGDVAVLPELREELSEKPTRVPHRVKTKLPNGFGLYDMQGSEWEWCLESAGTAPPEYHPVKGGSWISIPESCRPSRRQLQHVEHTAWNIGFRVMIPAS